MDKIQQGYVKSDLKNGIATIEFFHPSHNSLPGNLLAQLADAIKKAGKDKKVKVIVLKSGGERTFCAGASFDELISIKNTHTGKKFFMGFANVINEIRKCPKFVIGRVQGKAVGGGVGLASAVDYCIASKYASVKLSELAIGFGPFVIGPAVRRKMGTSAFSHLGLNATEWQTAAWAKDKGLFNEVFDSVEQVDAYIDHLCGKLTDTSPKAMKMLKKVFWEGTENWDDLLKERASISGKLLLTDHAQNAINKFKSKA